MRISDWSSDVCSSDLQGTGRVRDLVDAAWTELGGQAETVGLILEAFVPFERERSVVAVRGRDGDFRTWPVTENWHVDGVLSASLAPERVDEALARTAIGYARKLAEAMDYVGVFALELFCKDGQLLANERSEERRVGKECGRTCRSRWSPYH